MDQRSDANDSEPEEIDLKTSKRSVVQTLDNQKNAIREYLDTFRAKRRLINDKYVAQKTRKNKTIEKLSQNLLNEINIESIEASNESPEDVEPMERRRKVKKSKKRFDFETQSTHFDVLDVNNDLNGMTTFRTNDTNNGINFKDNMLFDRRRHKRIYSSRQKSYFDKQYLSRK